ncbi:MAG: DNA polymerase I [Firmicutes bacterium]|nr:DNA polymerase I [Bacillota bacterium]
MSQNRMLVIDGNSLAHRAFHAIPLLSNSEGIITNAAYGFTTMLFKVLQERKPELVAVAFDKGKITFRHSQYSEYKMHRKATPDELRPQFPLLKDILKAMRIPIFEVDNYEADDLIGAIVTKAEEKNLNCLIVSGDRDVLQLVSPSTTVLHTKKGISQLEEYDEESVKNKFGVTPQYFTDLKGLMGDSSDNIPGVPGIGPKTAAKLLQEYPSIEELLANKEKLPSRWHNKLEEFDQQALMSKELATITREVPVEIDIEKCRWHGPDYPELLQIFSRLEFKSLVKNIIEEMGEKPVKEDDNDHADSGFSPYTPTYSVAKTEEKLDQLKQKVNNTGKMAVAINQNKQGELTSIALTPAAGENFYVPLDNKVDNEQIPQVLKDLCSDPGIKKYCHDAKRITRLLYFLGVPFENIAFDTMVAAYLLNPGYTGLEVNELALKYLNIVLPSQQEQNTAAIAESIYTMVKILEDKLKENDLFDLYYNVELPLISILARMEIDGVAVDAQKLKEMSAGLKKQIEDIAADIYSLAGEEFNINSTRQLGQILFEKLELPVIKRTKTGYSTDAKVLEELTGSHTIIEKIITHRQLAKLKSTYVDGLTHLVNRTTGKLHTTFHQTVTATGRLSSAEPNLQNIPIRLEQGRRIRKVFLPRKTDNIILAADYSQIELRILAHMSSDAVLSEAFEQQQDIHSRTASEVFGVDMDQVTRDLRSRAKAVNFGIVYGMSEFGLSRDIKVTRAEAKRYIENYFARYTGVQSYIQQTIDEARKNGYVTTILHRKRYLPDIFSPNRNVRNFGERTAVNTPIQGSAADIIKLSMVKVADELKKQNLQAKMILQVHDELIFDVPQEELTSLIKLVRECMENAISLNVPLIVDLKAGPNWYDVKKL